jgi:hypothetical protein
VWWPITSLTSKKQLCIGCMATCPNGSPLRSTHVFQKVVRAPYLSTVGQGAMGLHQWHGESQSAAWLPFCPYDGRLSTPPTPIPLPPGHVLPASRARGIRICKAWGCRC